MITKFCTGCSACKFLCPVNAIEMEEDDYGFMQPVINETKCINCGICKNECPVNKQKQTINEPQAYAVINKNNEIREKSSSGGIFTLLAEEIIKKRRSCFWSNI